MVTKSAERGERILNLPPSLVARDIPITTTLTTTHHPAQLQKTWPDNCLLAGLDGRRRGGEWDDLLRAAPGRTPGWSRSNIFFKAEIFLLKYFLIFQAEAHLWYLWTLPTLPPLLESRNLQVVSRPALTDCIKPSLVIPAWPCLLLSHISPSLTVCGVSALSEAPVPSNVILLPR